MLEDASAQQPILAVRDMGDLPLGGFVKRLTVLSAMGVFLDGYDLTILSVALLFIAPQFHPTASSIGLLGAAALAGMFVGALAIGNLADRIGRRKMYLYDMAIFIVFAILSGLSQNVLELGIARFFLGIGIGADYPISAALTAEFAPTRSRGRLLAATIGFWQLGALFAYLVGLAMLGIGPEAWRWMLISGVVPAIVVMWLRRTIPESPRWLNVKGRAAEASAIVRNVALQQGKRVDLAGAEASNKPAPLGSLRQLFSPSVIRLTIFAALAWFMFDVGDYGSIVFTPTILKSLKGTTLQSTVLASTLLPAVSIVGIVIMWLIVDKVGRKPIQIAGFLVMGLVFALMGVVKPSFVVLFLLFLVVFMFMEGGPGQTTYIFAGEVFPTQIRATGQGFATAVSRLGGLLGVFVFPVMIASIGLSSGLFLFAGCAFVGMFITIWLGPETKNQRLTDVEAAADIGVG